MKKILSFIFLFCGSPMHEYLILEAAPKQAGKGNKLKNDKSKKNKDEKQRKQAQERAKAEIKKRAEDERKRKEEIETERKKRLQNRIKEAKEEILKCETETKALTGRYKKLLGERSTISDTLAMLTTKSKKIKSESIKIYLSKMDEQFHSKEENVQQLVTAMNSCESSERETQQKQESLEFWENRLLESKRKFGTVQKLIKSLEEFNRSYSGYIYTLVSEFVQHGVSFSEKDKVMIKNLTSR